MRLLAILLAATSLFAERPVSLHPIGPTSIDPIALHIPVLCSAINETVERAGPLIKVNLRIDAICDPPSTVAHVVKLDPLPPGEYRVEVRMEGIDGIYASTRFLVRNGAGAPFVVHPFDVRTIPSGLRMWIGGSGLDGTGDGICPNEDCSDVGIGVGTASVTNIRAEGRAATFDAPTLPAGLYDVTLRRGEVVTTATAAVYVFEEPDPSVFERILFPVLDSLSGANGSEWVSETLVSNPKPWFVENDNSVNPAVCLVFPCTERLGPRELTGFRGMGHPHGLALLAARPEAPDLAFSLRARDISREAEGFGTEIPVIREKDMYRNTPITLLGVPRDPRYRVKVRMYALDPFFFPEAPGWNVVIVTGFGPNATRTEQFLVADRECSSCPDSPAYVELDLPPGAKGEFSTLYITSPSESFAWAFASVTNNVTQQVTIVTPNGEGGEP